MPKKASEVLQLIADNDPATTTADFGNSSIFGMKTAEYTAKLCDGLAGNTNVTEVNLESCSINDACAAQLAAVIAGNRTIQVLNLKGNRIKVGNTALLSSR